jgi:hypothetical protein
MSLLRRIFGSGDGTAPPVTQREVVAESVAVDAQAAGDQIAELDVVGESYRQDVLAAVAGPKGMTARSSSPASRCAATRPTNTTPTQCASRPWANWSASSGASKLRCSRRRCSARVAPTSRPAGSSSAGGTAATVTSALTASASGSRPATRSVSGFVPMTSTGSYARSGQTFRRLAATRHGSVPHAKDVDAGRGSTVTVTCEEHYQATIGATRPAGWNPGADLADGGRARHRRREPAHEARHSLRRGPS